MAIIDCKECGKEVSSDAETCPACGVRVMRKSKALLYVILTPIGLGILFLAFGVIVPMTRSPAENAALNARRDCERVFPYERGRKCDQVYNNVYAREAEDANEKPTKETTQRRGR